MNYYVIQVAPKEEDKTEAHIRKIVAPDLYDACFHPMRIIRKKYQQQWVDVCEKLLPGYVFITTEHVAALYQELKRVPFLTKVLGRDLEYFVRLSEQEEQWLDLLLRQNREIEEISGKNQGARHSGEQTTVLRGHTVGLSQIEIQEGNEIRIVSGPLVGMEGMVRKIDLHRMIAKVEVPFMSGSTEIHLGIEMVERKDGEK